MNRVTLVVLFFLFGCALGTRPHTLPPRPPVPDFAVAEAPPAPPPPAPPKHGQSPSRALDAALWHLQYAQGLANQRSIGGAP